MPRNPAFPEGLSMRYVAYEQAGARLGVLPDALAGTFTCPRQATPSLTLSYPNGGLGVRGELLDEAVEIAVELSYDGQTWHEPYNGRFINLSSEWNLVDDGTEHRKADLIHIGHRLEGALVWNVPPVAKDKDGKYKFNSRNAGEILHTLWDAAVKRGWGAGLSLDASLATDSAGQPWATKTTLAFDPTVSLKSVLDTLMNMGMIDYRWRGRTLQVYNADSALKRENTSVVWRLGAGTTSAPEKLDWSQLCTHVLVKGDEGRTWTFPNPEAPPNLPRTEKVVSAGRGGLQLAEDLVGLEPQDLAAQRGDDAVEHLGGVLLDLGEDGGGARGQPSAELADGGLGEIHAVGVGETADQGAGTPSQQHAQWAPQNANGHADQAPADGRAPDHGILTLGQAQAAVGAALPDDGRGDSDPPLGGRSAQDAQRLVGVCRFLEADDDKIVCSHKTVPSCSYCVLTSLT